MKLSRKCNICGKEYYPRKDKIKTSKTCSTVCKGAYGGRINRKNQLEAIASKTEEENKKELEEAFNRYVVKSEGCWDWTGCNKGRKMPYGTVYFRGQSISAHRVSYELYKGKIEDGLSVLHKCDNPKCTNPEHLFLGTYLDNERDKLKKGRGKVEKLNIEQVKEIKKLIQQGELHKNISKLYGVSVQTIWSIQTGRTWGDITTAS